MAKVSPPANNSVAWVQDPCLFIREVLVNPETSKPFELYTAQERFLRELFKRAPDGRLLYPEAVYSCPKKSGKSTTAAMAMLYAVIGLGGRNAEGLVCANDRDQPPVAKQREGYEWENRIHQFGRYDNSHCE